MKNFLYSVIFFVIFLLIGAIIYLSTIGFETSKFNKIIIKEIKEKDSKLELKLQKIKVKLDLKKIQLLLLTKNPDISYEGVKINTTEIKVYTKIKNFFISEVEISQVVFAIKEVKIKDIQKIAARIKPSNFKTYLLNNLAGGEIEKALFNLYIGKNFKINEYKANGTIKKVNLRIKDNFIVQNIALNFIAENNLTLINSIQANYEGISVSNGSVNLEKEKDIQIKGKFNTQFNLGEVKLNRIFKKIKFFGQNKVSIQGSLLHEFNLQINNNFKIVDYEYKSSGNMSQSQIILKKELKNNFTTKPFKKILFKKNKIEINYNKKNKNSLILNGQYSVDDVNYKKFKILNNLKKNNQNYFIDLNLGKNLFFDIINFQTNFEKISNIKTEFNIKNNKLFFKSLDLTEGKNYISIKGLVINSKNEVEKISSIDVLTFHNKKENNNFKVNFEKKISIIGEVYDSTNLLKLLSLKSKSNLFKNFNKEIEIKLKNLITKTGTSLANFNLIGYILKGKFIEASAKSNFSKDKYLDISLKEDSNGKKMLEVYSDLPQALLADYKFFEGVKDGKLLYNSIADKTGSVSKLTIENFKVIKAPAFAKLLTLADLSGFADLLSGQGMTFDILVIQMHDDDSVTTIDEILALGSSVSLQMNGYVEKKSGLVSLSGTLVPAKTLNLLISKIPIVGGILVGNKSGDGIFGVSFKMKGLPGKIKTSINPIKTLTPRFITRAIEARKKN